MYESADQNLKLEDRERKKRYASLGKHISD